MILRPLVILLFLKTILCFLFCGVILGQQQTVWPISNDTSAFADVATSPFGPRDKNDSPVIFEYQYHGGIDLQAAEGTEVHAILGGTVKEADFQEGLAGNYVRIYHHYWFSEYFHLKDYIVGEDQEVSTGQVIGYAGKTGGVTGPHLHLGIFTGDNIERDKDHKENPVAWLNYTNTWSPWIVNEQIDGDNFIDKMIVEVQTECDELDLNVIEVYLHRQWVSGFHMRKIEMIFDQQLNVYNASATYFAGTTFETDVRIRPYDFDPGWDQVIQITVDPEDPTGFPNEPIGGPPKWMGIRVKDLRGKTDEWGNVTELPILPVINSFAALPAESGIKVTWTVGGCSEGGGIGLYRSKASEDGFVKINEQLINAVSSDSQAITEYSFVDQDVVPGIEYFYKLARVLKEGRTEFFSEIVSVMIIPDFALYPNYPNPFNATTIITYDIHSEKPVQTTLSIYNILGQKVRVVLEEEKSAGHYQIEWDGKDDRGNNVASGIYFYVLKTDKKIDKKKMLLLK